MKVLGGPRLQNVPQKSLEKRNCLHSLRRKRYVSHRENMPPRKFSRLATELMMRSISGGGITNDWKKGPWKSVWVY